MILFGHDLNRYSPQDTYEDIVEQSKNEERDYQLWLQEDSNAEQPKLTLFKESEFPTEGIYLDWILHPKRVTAFDLFAQDFQRLEVHKPSTRMPADHVWKKLKSSVKQQYKEEAR